eukprot:CAMPEP_0194315726 /NCGR_PEP_ID=MMETSP0171-20130528/12523_1 /TAXON_ID=218684 /ORGANISM="Corethron pennatum, Strain L29A3" /LENGTH=659 /DNA_ID=CAMNT_0039071665 /DNA_START=176 /DNA_END=2155 /DNA_ORIENTATION=-
MFDALVTEAPTPAPGGSSIPIVAGAITAVVALISGATFFIIRRRRLANGDSDSDSDSDSGKKKAKKGKNEEKGKGGDKGKGKGKGKGRGKGGKGKGKGDDDDVDDDDDGAVKKKRGKKSKKKIDTDDSEDESRSKGKQRKNKRKDDSEDSDIEKQTKRKGRSAKSKRKDDYDDSDDEKEINLKGRGRGLKSKKQNFSDDSESENESKFKSKGKKGNLKKPNSSRRRNKESDSDINDEFDSSVHSRYSRKSEKSRGGSLGDVGVAVEESIAALAKNGRRSNISINIIYDESSSENDEDDAPGDRPGFRRSISWSKLPHEPEIETQSNSRSESQYSNSRSENQHNLSGFGGPSDIPPIIHHQPSISSGGPHHQPSGGSGGHHHQPSGGYVGHHHQPSGGSVGHHQQPSSSYVGHTQPSRSSLNHVDGQSLSHSHQSLNHSHPARNDSVNDSRSKNGPNIPSDFSLLRSNSNVNSTHFPHEVYAAQPNATSLDPHNHNSREVYDYQPRASMASNATNNLPHSNEEYDFQPNMTAFNPNIHPSESSFQETTIREELFLNPDGSCSKKVICVVLPGKLGIVVDKVDDGFPVVDAIRSSSPLAKVVVRGDRLFSIDDENVSDLSAMHVSKIISERRHNPERILVFVRKMPTSNRISAACESIKSV